jgi:CDP-glycerol glycerophosphotransferase
MIKLIKKIGEEIIANLIAIPLILLSWIVPKKKGLFLLTSSDGTKFKDNPKYFYLYLLKNKKNVQAYWATKNKKLYQELKNKKMSVTYLYSPNHFILTLRAEFIICDDTHNGVLYDSYFWYLGNFKNIQIWHGTPFKKIGLHDDKYQRMRNSLRGIITYYIQKRRYQNYKLICSSCSSMESQLKSAFLNKQIKTIGFPRNDILYNGEIILNDYYKKLKIAKFNKLFLYAPTYRDHKRGIKPFSINFLLKLDKYLIDENYFFLIKKHLYEKNIPLPSGLSNIYDISNQIDDIQEILVHTDFLITDYSSVFFDFVLTKKPIIYYPYDYENYLKECRGMYYDYNKELPGPFARNEDELFSLIKNIDKWFKNKIYQKKYTLFKNKFNKYQDGNSCKRLYKELIKLR